MDTALDHCTIFKRNNSVCVLHILIIFDQILQKHTPALYVNIALDIILISGLVILDQNMLYLSAYLT